MSINRYLAIAEEEEFGVLPGVPEWIYYDIQSVDLSGPDDQADVLETAATRMPRFLAPGNYITEGSIALPVDTEQFGWILKGVLGEVESVLQNGDYLHTFTVGTVLPTFTIGAGKDTFEHRFAGVSFNELTLEFEERFLVASVDCVGGKDSAEDLQTVAETDLPQALFTGLCTTTTKNEADISAEVVEFTITINNNIDTEGGIPISSRFPVDHYAQSLEITAEATLIFEDETELQEYWGDSAGPAEKHLGEHSLLFHFEPFEGEAPQLEIDLPRVVVQSLGIDVNERDRIEQTVSYQAFVDDATGEAIVIDLLNSTEDYAIA